VDAEGTENTEKKLDALSPTLSFHSVPSVFSVFSLSGAHPRGLRELTSHFR
jgi:hypothetical protein